MFLGDRQPGIALEAYETQAVAEMMMVKAEEAIREQRGSE